jgi:Family of unknown function (DUF5947)
MTAPTANGSRLRRLAKRTSEARTAALEHCELCSEAIGPEHRHMLDLRSRELMCACQACTLLFDGSAAGGGHYRLVPDRRLLLVDFALDEPTWANLRIPVDMAFFFHSSEAGRVVALYPSPAGATESLLGLEAWSELAAANPVIGSLEPDVETLLVNRARGERQHFLVPIEDAYRLVALIRTRWRGFTGGQEVWEEIEEFFAALSRRAKELTADEQEARWPTSRPASQT